MFTTRGKGVRQSWEAPPGKLCRIDLLLQAHGGLRLMSCLPCSRSDMLVTKMPEPVGPTGSGSGGNRDGFFPLTLARRASHDLLVSVWGGGGPSRHRSG